MKGLGEAVPGFTINTMIKEVDTNNNGTIELEELEEVIFVSKNIVCVNVCYCREKTHGFRTMMNHQGSRQIDRVSPHGLSNLSEPK